MSAPAWHQPLPRMAAWIPREDVAPLRWTRHGLKPDPTLLVSGCVVGWRGIRSERLTLPPKEGVWTDALGSGVSQEAWVLS